MTIAAIAPRPAVPLKAWVLLCVLSLAWGLTWPIMKMGLDSLPILSFRATTAVAGGCVLLALVRLGGYSIMPVRGEWGRLLVSALFNITLWFGVTGFAVSRLAAGHAAILTYTMPVWSFLIAWLVFQERPRAIRLVGLACGMAAVAVLSWDALVSIDGQPLGTALMLSAAMIWAIGASVQQRARMTTPLLVLIGWQLLLGSLPLLTAALLLEDVSALWRTDSRGLFSLAFITCVPICFGYWAWYRILQLTDIGFASLGMLQSPIWGLAASAVILGEAVGAREITALGLILLALITLLPIGDRLGLGTRKRT